MLIHPLNFEVVTKTTLNFFVSQFTLKTLRTYQISTPVNLLLKKLMEWSCEIHMSFKKTNLNPLIWNLVDWCKEEEQGLIGLTENISRIHWYSYQLEGASNPHTNPTTHRKHHNQHKHLDPYTPQLFFF